MMGAMSHQCSRKSFPAPQNQGMGEALSIIGTPFPSWVADMMCLCAYLSSRWREPEDLRMMAEWSSMAASRRSWERSPLFGGSNSRGSSRHCASILDWIFCQMSPTRAGHWVRRLLWQEAVEWTSQTEAKRNVSTSSPAKGKEPQRVFWRAHKGVQLYFAFLFLSRILCFFCFGFDVTALV